MEQRRFEDRIMTLLCFGISGIALTLGLWIAISPLEGGSGDETARALVLAEVR